MAEVCAVARRLFILKKERNRNSIYTFQNNKFYFKKRKRFGLPFLYTVSTKMLVVYNKSLFMLLLLIYEKGDLHQDALKLLLEPQLRLLLRNLVLGTNVLAALLPPVDAESGASHNNVKVHAVDAGVGVVLESKIDVLLDTEAKVARIAEVALLELVLLHLEAALEDLHGLLAAHSHVARDLFVTADAERADRVARLGLDDLLAGERLEHLARASETIATLADRYLRISFSTRSSRILFSAIFISV